MTILQLILYGVFCSIIGIITDRLLFNKQRKEWSRFSYSAGYVHGKEDTEQLHEALAEGKINGVYTVKEES
jgi:hypothetical protein